MKKTWYIGSFVRIGVAKHILHDSHNVMCCGLVLSGMIREPGCSNVFTSRVSGRGHRIGAVFLSVCVCVCTLTAELFDL